MTVTYDPTYDQYIQPIKNVAKEHKLDTDGKLTQSQDFVAKKYGKDNWQSLTYWLKQRYKECQDLSLSTKEWGYIYDLTNSWGVELHRTDKIKLYFQIMDADIYENYGLKWFGESSPLRDLDDYEPSPEMMSLLNKIIALTEDQAKALLLKALAFWGKTFVIR